jgi:pimeloyl-ACP methyl ester carboxylesterase
MMRSNDSLPVVLVPGLIASPRFYAAQIPALWQFGPVTVADHTRDDSMSAIAQRLLAAAPPRFALVGHSLGGYIAFEIMRQAPERVAKLALLDTSARADTPEQTERRRGQIAQAQTGPFEAIIALQFPAFVHPSRKDDASLRSYMRHAAEDCGPEVFIRQQNAMIHRPDSRPDLDGIRCPTVVIVGDADHVTPRALAQEIAGGIDDATLVVVPDCGHMSAIERPEAVTQALVDWLK